MRAIEPTQERASTLIDEKGASAVFLAMVMLLLMGFAAVAVDAGIAYEDRRQQQSAADVGALAAVQFARTGLPASHPDCAGKADEDFAACRGAEEALAVVEGTLPGRYDDDAWDACVDSSKPAEFTQQSFISDCISFTGNFEKARVALPGTDVDTAFARLIGFNSIAVSALAEASVDFNLSADVLPFALGPDDQSLDEVCLNAPPSGSPNTDLGACDESKTSGNFGKLDLMVYGKASFETFQDCSGAAKDRMEVTLITGSDHQLEIASATAGTVEDQDNCAVQTNPVDNLETWTGDSGALKRGLFVGTSRTDPDFEGRLLCKTGESDEFGSKSSDTCANVLSSFESLDDTPAWNYITGYAAGAHPECSSVSNRQQMETCIGAWRDEPNNPSTQSLFTLQFEDAPRFAAVPILAADPSQGFGKYDIRAFEPIYLETLFFGCGGAGCDAVHSPGEPSTGPVCPVITPTVNSCGFPYNKGFNPLNLSGMTAFMLTIDMLHPDTRESFPGSQGTIIFNLSR